MRNERKGVLSKVLLLVASVAAVAVSNWSNEIVKESANWHQQYVCENEVDAVCSFENEYDELINHDTPSMVSFAVLENDESENDEVRGGDRLGTVPNLSPPLRTLATSGAKNVGTDWGLSPICPPQKTQGRISNFHYFRIYLLFKPTLPHPIQPCT